MVSPKTVFRFFSHIPQDNEPYYQRWFFYFSGSFVRTLVSFVASLLLFPTQAGLISAFFTSFWMIKYLENVLEKNKTDIWEKRLTPIKANADMALSILIMFMAVAIAYGSIVFSQTQESIKYIFFTQIHDTMTHTHLITDKFKFILANRITICGIFFLVSLIFRLGSIFVIVWMASVWGVVYGIYLKQGFVIDLPALKHYYILLDFKGFAVFLLRTLSFITAGMAGLFLSKALTKYEPKSKEFIQVSKAVAAILMICFLLILVAVYLEYKFVIGGF